MNKFKRWYYELTEKQISRIKTIMTIIGILFSVIIFFITYLLGRLPNGLDLITYIFYLCLTPYLLSIIVYLVLSISPHRQEYIREKEHIKLKEKFGLGPEFKEILYVSSETADCAFGDFFNIFNELGVKYFVKEIDGVILISFRSKDEKELRLHILEDYNFFNSNFEPKE